MKRNKKFIGFSTIGMSLALVASVLVYTYQFSPKALADQLVTRGIASVENLPKIQLNTLREQLGGDPAEALKEAKAAKDLRIISKEEFTVESQKSTGTFATSLGGDNASASFSMFSVKAPNNEVGAAGMSVGGSTGGGAMTGGSVQIKEGELTTMAAPPSLDSVTIEASGTASSADPSKQMVVNVSGNPSPDAALGADAGIVLSANSPNNLPNQVRMPENAKTLLRYTDKNGRVTVLSLDNDGLPYFRTIFMKASDLQK